MGFQTTVNKTLANGVVGEIYDDSIRKIDTFILESDPVVNTIGYAFTSGTEGKAACGGTDDFVGILVNPKQYANYNIGLGASNTVPDGIQASLCKFGRVWADVGGAGNVGDSIYYVNATGALGAGTAGAGQTQIPNCKIFYYPATSNGLAVIELMN